MGARAQVVVADTVPSFELVRPLLETERAGDPAGNLKPPVPKGWHSEGGIPTKPTTNSDANRPTFRRNPTTFVFALLGTSDPGGAQASQGR